jgi:glycosyltransferase involved in cell wall biosynthesis
MNELIPISVAILTRNSGKTLARALESVRTFADIIVCDGGSTDDTVEIAKRFGARIIPQDPHYLNTDGSIANYAGVRNGTLSAATYDWFLYIDSDEYLSTEAGEEIAHIARHNAPGGPLAYRLPRKTVVNGKVIECATVYPNYQIRFFNKRGVDGFIKNVHERPALLKDTILGTLTHPEFVPLEGKESFYKKQRRYLAIEVERHKDETLGAWLTGPFAGSIRSSASYLLRHLRILLFCRGTFMPLWVEWSHHWYNWKLVTMTGSKFFQRRENKKNR